MIGRQVTQGVLFYQFRLYGQCACRSPAPTHRRADRLRICARALAATYSTTGRPSIDPELMLRMLLIGYQFGIPSERRLCKEVHLNLAYRWFCRLDLADRVPDQSTFSKNRYGRFRACDLHCLLFEKMVAECAAAGLVARRDVAVDGSTIMADASREKKLRGWRRRRLSSCWESISRPIAEYLAALDAALLQDPDELALVNPTSTSLAAPCVDGPPLASLNSRVAMLVGAATCPTCCAAHSTAGRFSAL